MKRTVVFATALYLTAGGCEKPCKEGFQRYGADCVRSPQVEAGVDSIEGSGDQDAANSNSSRDAAMEVDGSATCYRDLDGDGVGAGGEVSCNSIEGDTPVATAGDCDDDDAQRSPLLRDTCGDSKDNDCDGETDEDDSNACGGPCGLTLNGIPGQLCTNGLLGECARTGTYVCESEASVVCDTVPASPTPEVCNGKDDNCDGVADEGLSNACGGSCLITLAHEPNDACSNGQLGVCLRPGKYVCDGLSKVRCDAPAVAPGTETCGDQFDNDCDGQINEADAPDAQTWYPDCDGDTFATATGAIRTCTKPSTEACKAWLTVKPVAGSTLDCNDSSNLYRPNWPPHSYGFAVGAANGDRNCNGVIEIPTQAMLHPDGIYNDGLAMSPCSPADTARINSGQCPLAMCVTWGKTSVSGTGIATNEPPALCVDNFQALVVGPPVSGSIECDSKWARMTRGGFTCM